VDWADSAMVLRRIGRPALEPLVEAMASAPTPEVARGAGWAYGGLAIDDLSVFVPGLRHPSPKVRKNSAYVLQCRGEAALSYAPELVGLLADPDTDVRQRAIWALQAIGPGVVPLRTHGVRPYGTAAPG
jgi:HEAT repeat protein